MGLENYLCMIEEMQYVVGNNKNMKLNSLEHK